MELLLSGLADEPLPEKRHRRFLERPCGVENGIIQRRRLLLDKTANEPARGEVGIDQRASDQRKPIPATAGLDHLLECVENLRFTDRCIYIEAFNSSLSGLPPICSYQRCQSSTVWRMPR